MSDLADRTDIEQEFRENLRINQIRKAASEMPKGVEGECEHCGYSFKRIVGGYCGRCRDELRIK